MQLRILRRLLRCTPTLAAWAAMAILGAAPSAFAQRAANRTRQFSIGSLQTERDLPASRLRTRLEQLPAAKRDRALQWLRSFHFTEMDADTLHVDAEGGVFYIDPPADADPLAAAAEEPIIAAAPVPVAPFPTSLNFHSRPGAPNILYLNFSGEAVANSLWNTSLGRAQIIAQPFSTDGDVTTFSDSEQVAIKRIWERVAEDYAPFNIDVTTERPATFTTRTAEAVITNTRQADGQLNPADTAGGVAYVNVFATSSYASYRPAWIYANNLGNDAGNIAEAASHEIGHNLGLSHDGRTDGLEYYGGHGAGEISWGPIMGTGYGRAVSQWSKGEYYLANNTQDDLAIIAGKITYLADDHGDTLSTATPLVYSGGTNIVSTTLDNDPTRTNSVNKGVIERNTDIDVFSFITGNGPVRITINPWITPSGTRGNDLDVRADLYDEAGVLLLTADPALNTGAVIQTNLLQGAYYIAIRNSAAGTPLSASPSGYTAYGSIGQFFINGYVSPNDGVIISPRAQLAVTNITDVAQPAWRFTVTYTDNVSVNTSTIDANDLQITGPNGYDQPAQFISVNSAANGTPRVATYAAVPPNGTNWTLGDSGIYKISMRSNEVADVEGAFVPAIELGSFTVAIPTQLYVANMDADPGWTLDPAWAYGIPNDGVNGPKAGYTGAREIGYNLSGNYGNNLTAKYAVTPPIDCSTNATITLRFRRWLRVRNGDTASIQVSTNNLSWTNIWAATSTTQDASWQDVRYTLPAWVAGSPAVRIRWTMASNATSNDIGWNMDDVQVLGDGTLDTQPPTALLSVASLTAGGDPTHVFSVTYNDQTAVKLSTLDGADILITGPNGYSNTVAFIGADLPADGSPITASYSVSAPNGLWSSADNGTYAITLVEGEVTDTLNNGAPMALLGSFTVNIPAITLIPFDLTLSVNNTNWGTIERTGLPLLPGTIIDVTATPAPYFRFVNWSGDLGGADNPTTLLMDGNKTVTANFAEVLTTNHPTPEWWLAQAGYTNDFEAAADLPGANTLPLWESYQLGLTPDAAQTPLKLQIQSSTSNELFLTWTTLSDRVYTIQSSAALEGPYTDLSSAVDLPASTTQITVPIEPATSQFFRLQMHGVVTGDGIP